MLPEKVPFPKLVMEVLKKLEGAYAVLVKSTLYPGELVACKRGSPMILGIRTQDTSTAPGFTATRSPVWARRDSFNCVSDSLDERWRTEKLECWVASDASAVIEHTKKVIVMEDNDVLHITGGGYGIYNTTHSDVEASDRTKRRRSVPTFLFSPRVLTLTPRMLILLDPKQAAVTRVLQTLQMEVEQIMKGGFDHFMQKAGSLNPSYCALNSPPPSSIRSND
jgi:glucosamine--fructose-6-phosphate aminotransferase (isomerizing)